MSFIISLIKTVLFNFRCFPLKTAIKLPVLIGAKVNVELIGKSKGKVVLVEPVHFAMASFGRGFGSGKAGEGGVKVI